MERSTSILSRVRVRLALAAAGAAALLTIAVLREPAGEDAPAAPGASSPTARSAEELAGDVSPPAWSGRPSPAVGPDAPAGLRAGDVLAYDAQAWFRVEAQPAMKEMGEEPIVRSLDLRGTFEVRVMGGEGGAAWHLCTLTDASLTVELGREQGSVPGEALEGLRRGVLVRLGPSGRGIVETRFDAALGAEERNLLRTLLAWLHLPAAAMPAGGLVTEEDVTGRYQADYAVKTTGDGIEFSRAKPAYEAAWAVAGQDAPVVESTESVLEGLFDPRREIVVRARARERLEYRPEQAFRWMRVVSSGRLELREVAHDPTALRLDELLASMVEASPVRPDAGDAAEAGRPRIPAALAAVPVDELPAMLARLARAGDLRSQAAWTIFQALAAHLVRDPELARAYRLWILDTDLPAEVRAAVTTSLGAAGTPEAQEVLAGLIEESNAGADVQEAATFAVHQVERPTARLEGALRDAALSGEAHAPYALFALGTVLGRTGDDARRADRLHGFLGDVADGASDERARLAAIEALGNSKSERVYEDLAGRFDRARSAEERRAATRALASLDVDRSREFLARHLGDEADPEVRIASLAGLAGCEEHVRLVEGVALRDDDAAVRRAAVRALGERSGREARAALERVREQGVDDEIREEAARLLTAEN